jgi:hypothetical protein
LRTKTAGLPSWIPDFSVDLDAELFDTPLAPGHFTAGGPLPSNWIPSPTAMNQLPVEGFRVDDITEVGSTRGCYFRRTADVVYDMPHRYNPGRLVHDQDAPTISEAYWRTLLADTIWGTHPAPVMIGFEFADWMCRDVLETLSRYTVAVKGPEKTAHPEQVTPNSVLLGRLICKEFLCDSLGKGEAGNYIHYEMPECDVHTVAGGKVKDLSKLESESQLQRPIRFIPDRQRIYSFVTAIADPGAEQGTRKLEVSFPRGKLMSAFEARLKDVKRGHRMIRTREGYIGMGPVSAAVGDEIWVLRGARVPFVLRPRAGGDYQVIGEAYVHGIMHGEALKGEARSILLG